MTDETTPGRRRRVPLRFASLDRWGALREAVDLTMDRAEHSEGNLDDWADLPEETADSWDATCWFPASGAAGEELWRPELLPLDYTRRFGPSGDGR